MNNICKMLINIFKEILNNFIQKLKHNVTFNRIKCYGTPDTANKDFSSSAP